MDPKFRPYQKESPFSCVYGVYPTIELLRARPRNVVAVIASSRSGRNAGLAEIRATCNTHHIPIQRSDRTLRRLSPKENHQVMSVFEKYRSAVGFSTNHVVLVNPSSRGNVGTIIRSMVGMGFADLAIILPAVDIFHPQTIRASMGSLFRISFQFFDSLEAYRQAFPRAIYALRRDGSISIRDLKPATPFSVVFGNEGAGLPRAIADSTDVRIPQSTGIDSLNLACATAIVLYEMSLAGQPPNGISSGDE